MDKQGPMLPELGIDDIGAVSGGESTPGTVASQPPQAPAPLAPSSGVPTPGPFPNN